MISIGKAIDSVILDYTKGRRSRDSRLSTQLVYSSLLNSRATLIRQQSNKNQNINHWIYQVLDCVDTELVTADDCKILRSKTMLPKLISDAKMDLLGTVSTSMGNLRYEPTPYNNIKYRAGAKYTSDRPTVYLQDGYLYITKVKMLGKVRVPGIFEDPIEVYNFDNSCTPVDSCIDYNEIAFPIDRDLFDTIVDMTSKKLAEFFLQTTGDERIDSEDNDELKKGMIHQ